MSDVASVFSVEKILLTALIAAAASRVFLFLRRRSGTLAVGELVSLGVLVGFSVFAWRMVGNVAPLNNDPIPPFSPNDLLCPMITYVLLGIYAAFRPPSRFGTVGKDAHLAHDAFLRCERCIYMKGACICL